jgi:CheY-like chemotaxis protein
MNVCPRDSDSLSSKGTQNLENASILVVDDEALIRMDVMYILEDAGYSVMEASSADEAIVMLERFPGIDAVLTDINMPGTMDGLELSHTIRDRWPLIGLVITSGRFAGKSAQIPAGVQFISKPYTHYEIVAALHNCAA